VGSARRTSILLLSTAAFSVARVAGAGGFEHPDNGTEALGRGAAFTAKADDPTALLYNVAGLARQRGTKVLFNANLSFSDYEFRRAGTYPDDPNDPLTPWGGRPFPAVRDTGGAFFGPMLALTSDFGLDRLTFGLGIFGPSSIGFRNFPLGVDGQPSPARYDTVQVRPRVLYPTLAAAYRITDWLDLGLGLSLVYASFDVTSVSYAYPNTTLCPRPEYQPCDARNHLETSGWSATPQAGVMARPASWLAAGANFRAGTTIATSGTASAVAPLAAPLEIQPAPAELKTSLPWVLRTGVRLISMDKDRERADVELDFTYEAWGSAQGEGPKVTIPRLGIYDDLRPTVQHRYRDTFSLRLGGAYNFDAGPGRLTLRAGTYYDASATRPSATRLDFDTLAKIGVTLGIGYRVGSVVANVALAEVFEPPREVTDGEYRPINGARQGQSIAPDGTPLPPTNEGRYEGHLRIVSLGVTILIDELFGGDRKPATEAPATATRRDP
jgi:long-chain fatty acid transport protein